MIRDITKGLKDRKLLIIRYFISMEKIFSTACPDVDRALVFGCEIYLFSFQRLRRRVNIIFAIISEL